MERAQELRAEQVSASDLVVWCTAVDLSDPERMEDVRLRHLASRQCPAIVRVITRCDVMTKAEAADPESGAERNVRVSAATGEGIESLRSELLRQLSGSRSARSELLSSTAVRCRDSLRQTIQSLDRARSVSIELCGDELIAIEIRRALLELGTILGEVYTDDILDHIFSSFCIGK